MVKASHFALRSLYRHSRQLLQTWQQSVHPARQRFQGDPLARLQSAEEVPIALALGIRIDVNQATVDEWLRLPVLSIHQARTLTTLSQRGVAFYCIEDIAAVLGISQTQLHPFRPLLQFCYYDPLHPGRTQQVSLNEATGPQLLALSGMSTPLVNRILNERRRSPYRNWADAHQRLRLTPEQTAQWMHQVRI
ncbi:MAG: ComEA family DNA-binding protein [Cyanobacteria bacterium J06638_28]